MFFLFPGNYILSPSFISEDRFYRFFFSSLLAKNKKTRLFFVLKVVIAICVTVFGFSCKTKNFP